jgi:hypothetical protein
MKFAHIVSSEVENMGGGCMVDILTMADGKVVVISDDYVGMYESKEAFFDSADQLNGFYIKE